MKSSALSQFEWLHLIYDTLLYPNADGTFEPRLAADYEIVDPQTVTVTLRGGLKFQDGTPLDGEALKFTLERNRAAENGNFNPALSAVQAVEVAGLTVTIRLARPVAGSFVEVLAGRESMPVSPTAAAKGPDELSQRPVGAGPYQLSSVTIDQLISLKKYPGHWEADQWKLGAIDFVQVAAGPTQVTALRSDAVDVGPVTPADTASLGGDFEVRAVNSDSNFSYVATCKSQPPFDNLDFRKAFAYTIDREQIIDLVQAGEGEPMWMMWPKGTRYYTEALEGSYARDLDRSRAHLTAAGYPDGIDFDLMYQRTGLALAEVLQAQLAEVGIRVTLVATSDIVTDFYTNVATPGAVSAWIRPGLQKVTRAFGPEQRRQCLPVRQPRAERPHGTDRRAGSRLAGDRGPVGSREHDRRRERLVGVRDLAAVHLRVERSAAGRRDQPCRPVARLPDNVDQGGLNAPRYPVERTAPAPWRATISSSEQPSSRRISFVCWPISGAGRPGRVPAALMRNNTAMSRTSPQRG